MAASAPRLRDLPNLGPKSEAMLVRAGIATPDQLRAAGSVAAYRRVVRVGERPSLNLLWALEGAISGDRWTEVSREHRTSLLLALDALDGGDGQVPARAHTAASGKTIKGS